MHYNRTVSVIVVSVLMDAFLNEMILRYLVTIYGTGGNMDVVLVSSYVVLEKVEANYVLPNDVTDFCAEIVKS